MTSELDRKRKSLQELMIFAVALAQALEKVVGRGASSMTFAAGRRLGRSFSEGAQKTDDIMEALGTVRRVLEFNHFNWGIEAFCPHTQSDLVIKREDGSQELQLVFRDCMIRQSLFRFGHPQKGSLCSMMYGFFSGALENIMGRSSKLDIIHAGENACLKVLRISA